MKGEGSRCLRESQASVESSSPARSATALECFLIATVKRISHMAFTAASERPSTFTSATILHPDTVCAPWRYSDSIQEPDDELDLKVAQKEGRFDGGGWDGTFIFARRSPDLPAALRCQLKSGR